MLYFQIQRSVNGSIVGARVLDEQGRKDLLADKRTRLTVECRSNWNTIQEAERVAELLGPSYIATDAGPNIFPRYDVIRAPQVGDEVSYAFNGDSYPCGRITRVSDGPVYRRVVATDEQGYDHIFYRRLATGQWLKNRTWSLVRGHHDHRNPEF